MHHTHIRENLAIGAALTFHNLRSTNFSCCQQRALVVEDEEPLQEIVHDALKDGGFDLTTVASGQEAVAMIESGVVKYSALVTDVNLKGPMKGWEIARLVRQIDPAFPVVYMTGAAADDWASEGVPNSILLKKPFAPAQLVTAVSQLLNTGSPTSG